MYKKTDIYNKNIKTVLDFAMAPIGHHRGHPELYKYPYSQNGSQKGGSSVRCVPGLTHFTAVKRSS